MFFLFLDFSSLKCHVSPVSHPAFILSSLIRHRRQILAQAPLTLTAGLPSPKHVSKLFQRETMLCPSRTGEFIRPSKPGLVEQPILIGAHIQSELGP